MFICKTLPTARLGFAAKAQRPSVAVRAAGTDAAPNGDDTVACE
jgi:hypothetical protein